MADIEEVLKGFESHLRMDNDCSDCPYFKYRSRCIENLQRDAFELLKDQEPVTPFIAGKGKTFEEARTWWYSCGNCQQPIDMGDRYCSMCGRRVKWDG